jgi:hypothetical protein
MKMAIKKGMTVKVNSLARTQIPIYLKEHIADLNKPPSMKVLSVETGVFDNRYVITEEFPDGIGEDYVDVVKKESKKKKK